MTSAYVQVSTDYDDPARRRFETVENKGPGHPDSLADAVANAISVGYSQWCLDRFGAIPHHNVDKVYVGGGWFASDFGVTTRKHPIVVSCNGRMSNVFGGEEIPLEQIVTDAATGYLQGVLPHAEPSDFLIQANASQHTKVPFWYTPRGLEDLPDATNPRANDTSVCIAHYGATAAEALVDEVGRYFWSPIGGLAVPRFRDIGQDIKVLAVRNGNHIEVEVCVPTIASQTESEADFFAKIRYHEHELRRIGQMYAELYGLEVSIGVNTNGASTHQRRYMLGIGTCAECGEEGLVGRGNSINGLISTHRHGSVEAFWGKNPVYHTGRVMGFKARQIARSIGSALGCECTVAISTRAGDTLFPPRNVQVSVGASSVDEDKVQQMVDEIIMAPDYVRDILGFQPWVEPLL